MNIGKKGIDLIKQFEGYRLEPYLCPAKIPTIGYGTTVYPDGHLVQLTDPKITRQLAEEYLISHLKELSRDISRLIKVPVSQNQFDALCSLVYNIGIGNFKKSSVLKYLNEEKYPVAANKFLMWDMVQQKESNGLKKRRLKERELFLTS